MATPQVRHEVPHLSAKSRSGRPEHVRVGFAGPRLRGGRRWMNDSNFHERRGSHVAPPDQTHASAFRGWPILPSSSALGIARLHAVSESAPRSVRQLGQTQHVRHRVKQCALHAWGTRTMAKWHCWSTLSPQRCCAIFGATTARIPVEAALEASLWGGGGSCKPSSFVMD